MLMSWLGLSILARMLRYHVSNKLVTTALAWLNATVNRSD